MLDFKRGRRKSELNQRCVGGLPSGDERMGNKKAYGEADGEFIGFMDDLTPCRVKRSIPDRPWFRLNNQFMDVKKNRCFSGPPTHWGYCARDLESAKKLFLWYSLARTFLQHSYPMWADAEDLWAPIIPASVETRVFQTAFAIAYAENDCVATSFPYGNPVTGAPELTIRNPLSPLDGQSFWTITLRPFCTPTESTNACELIKAVDNLFGNWQLEFRNRSEIPVSNKPYLLGNEVLTVGAGIVQIRDFVREQDSPVLRQSLGDVQSRLRLLKAEFSDLAMSSAGLNYFGSRKKATSSVKAPGRREAVGG
jgi:hypothetical protein